MELNQYWQPYRGAVSLTFDDGTQNQLDEVVPLLKQYQLKGTFYITPQDPHWTQQRATWVKVAQQGHEIGNHSFSHICSDNIMGKAGGLEEMTLSQMEEDILTAQHRLSPIAPHQKQWTFAYPCYSTDVGRGLQRLSYIPFIARHFLAGRAGGEYGFGNHPQLIDLAAVWGMPVERMSGFEMIGLVEEIVDRGHWAVLVFHEINGSRLTVGRSDFEMLLNYLYRNRSTIWTAPVVEVAQKIDNFQSVSN